MERQRSDIGPAEKLLFGDLTDPASPNPSILKIPGLPINVFGGFRYTWGDVLTKFNSNFSAFASNPFVTYHRNGATDHTSPWKLHVSLNLDLESTRRDGYATIGLCALCFNVNMFKVVIPDKVASNYGKQVTIYLDDSLSGEDQVPLLIRAITEGLTSANCTPDSKFPLDSARINKYLSFRNEATPSNLLQSAAFQDCYVGLPNTYLTDSHVELTRLVISELRRRNIINTRTDVKDETIESVFGKIIDEAKVGGHDLHGWGAYKGAVNEASGYRWTLYEQVKELVKYALDNGLYGFTPGWWHNLAREEDIFGLEQLREELQ